MSLLTICQRAAIKIGVSKPASIIGNTTEEAMELLEFAQEEGFELMRRYYWQALRKEKTELTLSAEEQTALPTDFDRFVNETFWNRSRKNPLYGPLSPVEWQYNKSWTSSPVTDSFTIRGNKILINPIPEAGQTISYEYISKNFCQSSLGVGQCEWLADTDTGILDERIISLGVVARFKLAKGLDASADLAKYETQVMLATAYESPKKRLNMASEGRNKAHPAVVVPQGDWSL